MLTIIEAVKHIWGRDLHMKYVSIADTNPAPRLASES